MKILFSPSESKTSGGVDKRVQFDDFIFPNLSQKRLEVIDLYTSYINSASSDEVAKIFGIKDQELIDYYKADLLQKKTKKPIERYNGVAFTHLNYASLSPSEKKFIDENVIIFSNLFGPILAGGSGIPEYKLKQGEKIGDFKAEEFYLAHFSLAMDDYLLGEDIIDLRAGFYEKFYKIKQPYLTMKFVKNDKVVSHFAKAYRGLVLREIAKNELESIDDVIKLPIKNLAPREIKESKFKTEIVYEIYE